MRARPLPKTLQSPFKVSIDITNRCNLRCSYCYFYDSALAVKEELSTDEWLQFFGQLKEHRVVKVTLAGGEPFVRTDLPLLLQGIARNRMRYTILSNGTLITESMAAMIAGENRCDMIQISIDGHTPAVHDSLRGEGSFAKAVHAIRLLQQYRVPLTVRCTLHKKNYRHIPEIARFLLDEIGLPSFSTNEAGYQGRCQKQSDSICLGPVELTEAMDLMAQAADQYPGRITANDGPLAKARFWTKMFCTPKGSEPLPMSGILGSCGCVFRDISVRADGTLVPCSHLDLPMGNIKTDDFNQVFRQHATMERLRKRRMIPLDQFEFCRDCPYLPACKGGCPASARHITGQDERPSPDSCLRLFLDQGGMLPDSVLELFGT